MQNQNEKIDVKVSQNENNFENINDVISQNKVNIIELLNEKDLPNTKKILKIYKNYLTNEEYKILEKILLNEENNQDLVFQAKLLFLLWNNHWTTMINMNENNQISEIFKNIIITYCIKLLMLDCKDEFISLLWQNISTEKYLKIKQEIYDELNNLWPDWEYWCEKYIEDLLKKSDNSILNKWQIELWYRFEFWYAPEIFKILDWRNIENNSAIFKEIINILFKSQFINDDFVEQYDFNWELNEKYNSLIEWKAWPHLWIFSYNILLNWKKIILKY